jgi:MarC family integral membrane protein
MYSLFRPPREGMAGRTVMIEAAKSLFLILSALFPIVDPLGGSPVFLAMTREYPPTTRKALSLRIAMNSFFLLIGSYFIGTHILIFPWNFVAGGPSRRWIDRHFNRLDTVEAG